MKSNYSLKSQILIICLSLGLFAAQSTGAQNLLADSSFEAGSPNPDWFEASTNFGTPLCTISNCGTGTGTGPRTGDWWVWFGGIGAYEEGEVSQSVFIPKGTATLSFWIEHFVASGNGLDYFQIEIDGNIIYYLSEGAVVYNTYNQVILDISTYADGETHTVRFYSEIFGPSTSNFFIDDVELIAEPFNIPLRSWSIIIVLGLILAFTIIRFRRIYS